MFIEFPWGNIGNGDVDAISAEVCRDFFGEIWFADVRRIFIQKVGIRFLGGGLEHVFLFAPKFV